MSIVIRDSKHADHLLSVIRKHATGIRFGLQVNNEGVEPEACVHIIAERTSNVEISCLQLFRFHSPIVVVEGKMSCLRDDARPPQLADFLETQSRHDAFHTRCG